ncbi:MAG: hypothetical protein JXJ04_01755, partial [Spirochaetales bacterium]|nr:hypothetical protein [Spirochaetales bacterium]
NTVIFNPAFTEVRKKLTNTYCDERTLREAYGLSSPVSYNMNVPPERIMILCAEYDQLTPPEIIVNYAKKRDINNIITYPESHTTILLNQSVYKDYAVFLHEMSSENNL